MKTLYLDLFSGISGDMLVGALLDLGADSRQLESKLQDLGLEGFHLHVTRGHKAGIAGVRFEVHLEGAPHDHGQTHPGLPPEGGAPPHEGAHGHSHPHPHPHSQEPPSHSGPPAHDRTFADIRQLLEGSRLSPWTKGKAVAIFARLALAEGRIHGVPPEQVCFHEVGALDSIVDIVGACLALELLGRPRLEASPVVDGTGWIDCAHGRFPIPAPATLAVLGARGIPLSQCEEPHELVTPTGAALLAELVERFGPMQNLTAEKIGFGLGTRDHVSRPNALRAILGESPATTALAPGGSAAAATPGSNSVHDWQTDAIAVLETNLDDIHAELLGRFVETALAEGALDVFHTPIQMKKSRPGVRLSVLCALADADKFTELILLETSAFGVRRYAAERRKLAREWFTVSTPHGQVQVKLGRLDGRVVQAAPEFESCKRVAEQAKVPLKQVYDAALRSLPPSLCAGPIHEAAKAGAGTASSPPLSDAK
ncbi:MAG TPA: nickel pincer cofactor biosynthesis protein LarC [Dongiaceae bacterium]|nr:nickel pincer cofactor biosynthesis protein LarC [Dongiaceae bacterium]